MLNKLMESESFKRNYGQNKDSYDAIDVATNNLKPALESFVLANINEFIEPTLEGTMKNIKVFTEFATLQGLVEMKSYVDNMVKKEDKVLEESVLDAYL